MRKLLLAVIGALSVAILPAQSISEIIHHDVQYSASNYMPYPGPRQTALTPAPAGMKPFYISHYGRHGSRYHSRPSMYNAPYLTLAKADSLDRLTALGKDVMHRLDLIRHDAENHWGELTPLGAQQHQQIARRMVERFPEVFEDKTDVDARSTTVGRCIMSMEYALLQLQQLRPKLRIHHNATHRDMYYLNQQDKSLMAQKFNAPAMERYLQFIKQHVNNDRLMAALFNDTAYVRQHVNATDLSFQLLLVAAIMQNTEFGKQVSLFDIFTADEIYHIWEAGNVRWYIGWGACPINGGQQPYTQRNLLRKLISDADSCIQQTKNNIQLRFGHETVVMPLTCLLDINGYGLVTDNLDSLEAYGWVNNSVIPMAANLQFVFYRRNPKDKDVVFKVLLNENEATLPLPTHMPPYYKWSDFRSYYLKKLNNYAQQP